MRRLVILAVVGALGVVGYRLHQTHRATQLETASVYLVCDTSFLAEAEPALQGGSGVGIQSTPPQVVKLAAWTRLNAPAEQVKAMTSVATLSRQEIDGAIARGVERARLECPKRVGALNPTQISAVLGSLIDPLKQSPGAKGSNPGESWVSWFSGFSIAKPSPVSAVRAVVARCKHPGPRSWR